MDIYNKPDLEIAKTIGLKIKQLRLDMNVTQAELRDLSGVSLRRIGDIENGGNHSILILIQLLRALNALDFLESFFTTSSISPIEYAKILAKQPTKIRVKSSIINNIKTEEVSEW